MSVGCLILAGGKGTRLGMEKMHYNWHGRALWEHAYSTCKDLTQEVVIVGLDIDAKETRIESIRSGLRLIDADKVIILDVSRPLTKLEDLQVLVEIDSPSTTYVTKIEGSLILSNGTFVKTPDTLQIENPQCFDTKLLKVAFEVLPINSSINDCCEIMKLAHGIDPVFAEAPYSVHKLIAGHDVLILDALCHA